MPPELKWFIGRQIKNVEKTDYTWSFIFDDHSSICSEGPWRLVTSDGIVVTSEDHGHQFGLPAPVDACQRILAEIGGKPVEGFAVKEMTGDLTLFFEEAVSVQLLQLSCGYENWRTVHGVEQVFCIGGGSLSFFNFDAP